MARRFSAGFSLIELLVVLMILALASAVVVPRLGVGAGVEARDEARRLLAALRGARGEAIVQQRTVRVVVDVASRSYRLDGGEPVQLAEGSEIRFEADPVGIVNDSTGELRFYPDGTASGARLHLQSRGGTHRIAVDWLTGRVRLDG